MSPCASSYANSRHAVTADMSVQTGIAWTLITSLVIGRFRSQQGLAKASALSDSCAAQGALPLIMV